MLKDVTRDPNLSSKVVLKETLEKRAQMLLIYWKVGVEHFLLFLLGAKTFLHGDTIWLKFVIENSNNIQTIFGIYGMGNSFSQSLDFFIREVC